MVTRVVGKLNLGVGARVVFLEQIRRRGVQLVQNPPAAGDTGVGVTRIDHACERGRTRKAQHSCKEQSSIHETSLL